METIDIMIDEYFPVYSIKEEGSGWVDFSFEVDDQLAGIINKTFEEYQYWQDVFRLVKEEKITQLTPEILASLRWRIAQERKRDNE